jgi:hypothetical protein
MVECEIAGGNCNSQRVQMGLKQIDNAITPDRRRETSGFDDDGAGVTGIRWSAASSEKNSRMKARRP